MNKNIIDNPGPFEQSGLAAHYIFSLGQCFEEDVEGYSRVTDPRK